VNATLPTVFVGQAQGTQDPHRTGWLGYWRGRVGHLKDIDMKIVVQEISADDRATLAYSWADTSGGATSRLVGVVSGAQIKVDMPFGERLNLDINSSGDQVAAEFIGIGGGPAGLSSYFKKGTLTRQLGPTEAEADQGAQEAIAANRSHEAVVPPPQDSSRTASEQPKGGPWIGYWHGWFGLRKETDMKMVIEEIRGNKARVRWAWASPHEAKGFVLRPTLDNGSLLHKQSTGWLAFRLRPSGNAIEVVRTMDVGGVPSGIYGVLYREPTPDALGPAK